MPQAQRSFDTPKQRFTAGGLEVLAAEISAACFEQPKAMAEAVKAALRRAVADPHLLTPEQQLPCADRYARHVIYSDPSGRFTILAIVWGAGQFSPPHAHHTWCSYAVFDGPLEETVFAWDEDAGKARPLRTEVRNPGYECYAGPGLDQIHKLGNAGERPAISIHVYGVERERISTHVNRVLEASNAAE